MSFTVKQCNALKKKLSYLHVKTRSSNGATIAYVEGWYVIAEANRIFGFDCWDRTTLSPKCLWSEMQRGQRVCFYTTTVRINVRAGDSVIVREGIGTGLGRSASPEIAHEIALKAAETDATKRALATFGNPFGLALYDKSRAKVTKPPQNASKKTAARKVSPPTQREFQLWCNKNHVERFKTVNDMVTATLREITGLPTIEMVYTFWDANNKNFLALRSAVNDLDADPTQSIITALKARVRKLGRSNETKSVDGTTNAPHENPKAVFFRPKERRIRDKSHLKYVAQQPCLICGRAPTQAHHIRFAQPRAMAMKVSDEYTVPLCNSHHGELHHVGDERAWWARHGIIEPLKIAKKLWDERHVTPPQQDAEPGPRQTIDSPTELIAGPQPGNPNSRD